MNGVRKPDVITLLLSDTGQNRRHAGRASQGTKCQLFGVLSLTLWTPCSVGGMEVYSWAAQVEEGLLVSCQSPGVTHPFSPSPLCAWKQEGWAMCCLEFPHWPLLWSEPLLLCSCMGCVLASCWGKTGRSSFSEEKLLAQSLGTIRKTLNSSSQVCSPWMRFSHSHPANDQWIAPSVWHFCLWFCSFLVLRERDLAS